MIDVTTLLIFIVVFCLVVAYRNALKPKNFPPGPPTSIFRGNGPQYVANKSMHKLFFECKKKYGPIFSMQLGWYPAVVISSQEIIKEAFVQHADQLSSRPLHMFLMRILKAGNRGLINHNGESWKASKRMAMTALREFGVGKAMNEKKVLEEVDVIITEIAKHQGEAFQFDLLFGKASCNVICSMLFGERHDYDDPEYLELLHAFQIIFKEGGLLQSYPMFLPYLFPLLFLSSKASRVFKVFDTIFKYIRKQIKQHRQSYDPDTIRDFIDIYLQTEQQEISGTPDTDGRENTVSFWGAVSTSTLSKEMNIAFIILDLFLAGTESTSTTLLWGIAYMIRYPDVQEKCRQHILEVVGRNSRPCLKDRENLKYVEATLHEIQRIGNIAPTGIMHCTDGPVTIHGYTIPDKTIVIPDLYTIHMDPEVWEEPEMFDPNRFLDESGNIVKPPNFMPFSIGNRACPGENLAKTELFLIFTSLLQNYRFTTSDLSQIPTIADGSVGLTLTPPLYNVIANAVE